MIQESPLYAIRIECPICRKENQYDAIRAGAYTEENRDTDFCPTDRHWHHPEYQAINPLTYFMATCETCHYTRELDGAYKNWQDDSTFKMYRQKQLREGHLEALALPDSVLKQLGTHLNVRRFPHETAINKLLLGIIDEQIVAQEGALNVARYYLRIAWLFRETGQFGDQNSTAWAWRRGIRSRIESQLDRWEEWISQAESLAESITEFAGTKVSTADLKMAESMVEGVMAEWATYAAEPHSVDSQGTGDHDYFQFADHTAFLMSLRDRWDDVPANEHEALGTALKYYIEFFEHSRSFDTPEQEVQTTYLIGELARRTGQTKVSSRYFNHAIRKGHELLNRLRHEVKRIEYIQNLVEMAIEQGKKNRDEPVVAV